MPQPPACLVYWADLLEDTVEFSDQELGAYIRLLGRAWINGSIPKDLILMSRLIASPPRELRKFWPVLASKFVSVNGEVERLVNPRMEIERNRLQSIRESRVEYGLKGAEARWKGYSKSHSKSHSKPYGKSDNDNKEEDLRRELNKKLDLLFDHFWGLYPRKVKKPAARKSFDKILRSSSPDGWDAMSNLIETGIKAWNQSDQWIGGRIEHPATFLNNHMWEDEVPPNRNRPRRSVEDRIKEAEEKEKRDSLGIH